MTQPAEYVPLADLVEWRRNARPGEWVTFAAGNPLDCKNPAVALVTGWERLGRVKVEAADNGAGCTFHRFTRTKADFPAGWLDPPAPLPEPPAIRNADAIGPVSMAYWAIKGGEDEGWIRRAVLEMGDRLSKASLELCNPNYPARDTLPEGLTDAVGETAVLLAHLAQLLDPNGHTQRQARIGWRKPGGGQATGAQWARVLKEWDAAAAVRKAEANGDKRYFAVPAVAKETGVSEGDIKARLAQWRRSADRPEQEAAAAAAGVAQALAKGGLLMETALAHAADLHGLPVPAVQKALKALRK